MKRRAEIEEGGEIPVRFCACCEADSTRLLIAQEAKCTLVTWCCANPACRDLLDRQYPLSWREIQKMVMP